MLRHNRVGIGAAFVSAFMFGCGNHSPSTKPDTNPPPASIEIESKDAEGNTIVTVVDPSEVKQDPKEKK